MRRTSRIVITLLVAIHVSTGVARATWAPNGTLVCSAANDQRGLAILANGSGGAFLVWQDGRPGLFQDDLYLQQLDALGTPAFAADGVAVCAAANDSYAAAMIRDDQGGVIVAWEDRRSTGVGPANEIYAQRMDSRGIPQWTANGVDVSQASGDQGRPQLVGDGAGGAIVIWEDGRAQLCRSKDVYAQRIDSNGARLWPISGLPVCTAPDDQDSPRLVADASGGAFAVWSDKRSEVRDVYAQRLSSAGAPLWAIDGVAVCSAPDRQRELAAARLDTGIVIVWNDWRAGQWSVHAQRLTVSGTAQRALDGVPASGTPSNSPPAVLVDGPATFVATGRGGDIYVQKLSAAGAAQWGAQGIPLCTAADTQRDPKLVSDGAGGLIATWIDFRNGNADIYAGRLDGAGIPQWASNGVALCTAAGNQEAPMIVSDGASGAIVAWEDARGGTFDVYAQRVTSAGIVAPTAAVEPGSIGPLRLDPARPNPAGGRISFAFTLPAAGRVALDVLDVTGRRIASVLPAVEFSAGAHVVVWDGVTTSGRRATSGLSFVRLVSSGGALSRPFEFMR